MATKTVEEEKRLELETDLVSKDDLVSEVEKLGCACAVDLAGEIGRGMRADDLIPALESLVAMGVLRHKENDPDDQRKYKGKYQVIYEVAEVK